MYILFLVRGEVLELIRTMEDEGSPMVNLRFLVLKRCAGINVCTEQNRERAFANSAIFWNFFL